jgi:recombination protein RecA
MSVNKIKLKEAMSQIKKKYGKDSLFILGQDKDKSLVKRHASNYKEFDDMLEGGLPESRVIEISGPEGVGKTSICLAIAASYEMSVLIDAEGTLDEDRARVFGVPDKRLLVERPESGEEVCDSIISFANANVPLIIIDSVPSIVPYEFLEKISKTNFVANNIAGTARLLSQKLFPLLIPRLKDTSTTIIFINQIRDKIGVLFGDPTDTPGGRALKHYSALRIQVRRKQWYGPVKNRIGQLCSFRVVKSKISSPYSECEIPLSFKHGFVSHQKMRKYLKEK